MSVGMHESREEYSGSWYIFETIELDSNWRLHYHGSCWERNYIGKLPRKTCLKKVDVNKFRKYI